MPNQYSRTYSINEIKLVIDLYLSGLPFTNVSLKLNINKCAVKNLLKKNSVWVEGRNSVKKEINEGKIIELYNSGLSLIKVGEVFNVSKTVIKRVVNKYGLLRKGNSDVMKITNKQNISELKNSDKRGKTGIEGAYHLDHKYSISEGFKQGIEPEIIGNISNLEFIPWEENLSKKNKCSVSKTELIKEFKL